MNTVKSTLLGVLLFQELAAKNICRPLTTLDGYAYHVTGRDAVLDIVSDGFMRPFKPSHGSDQDTWPDGGTEKRVYFAKTYEEALKFYNPDLGKRVMLRVPVGSVNLCDEGRGLDAFSRKPVKVAMVEYETVDGGGEWQPLTSFRGKTSLAHQPPSSLSDLLNLNEASKQSLINLGYPPSMASFMIEKFGKNAALMARWFKEYSILNSSASEWFHNGRNPSKLDDLSLYVLLYEALLTRDQEHYNKVREDLGLYVNHDEPTDFDQMIPAMKKGIEKGFFDTTFVNLNIVKAILSGKLTDLKPYAKMSFKDANRSYEDKLMFNTSDAISGIGHVLKRYPNGMLWVNAGNKCRLVGDDMGNCGSTGLMSLDPNSSMYVLYDTNKKGHAIFTLSPGDNNRVSGVQGKGSTEMKPEYNDYLLDAVKELGGWLDMYGSGTLNSELTLRYRLGDHLVSMEKIGSSGSYNGYRLVVRLPSGVEQVVYTNGYSVITQDDIHRQRYAGFLAGLETESDEAKAFKLLMLSANGQMYTTSVPRFRQWMESVGIEEPESKR